MKLCPHCGKPITGLPYKRKSDNNKTAIEIECDGRWIPFESVAEAVRQTGIPKWKIYQFLRNRFSLGLKVRLATTGDRR